MLNQIFMTVAVVGGINTLLAILLVTAERYLANYGEKTITINGDRKLTVVGGQSLLASLKSDKIFLPSACGGRGTCAYCKCQVESGAGPLLPTEAPLLTRDEIAGNVRLACQVKVKEDLQISIPEELFNIKAFQAQVAALDDLTHDIKLLRLKLSEPKTIVFKAGQYIQLQSQPYPGVKEEVSRAYSIASSCQEMDCIDLMIRRVPEGLCTTWVHDHLKVGDKVHFTGPMGDFYLKEGTGPLVMVAGGSGMAPIVSLLHDLHDKNDPRSTAYLFGAQTGRDLFYSDEMRTFEQKLPDFEFIPTLSRPQPEDEWTGKTGLITVSLAEHLASINTSRAQAYMCGSPGMIKACIAVLNENGISSDRIFYDPFS